MAKAEVKYTGVPRGVIPLLQIVTDPSAVDGLLTAMGAEEGAVHISAVLLQQGATRKGNAAAILVLEMTVDGKPVIAKASLAILEQALEECRKVAGPHRG